MSLMDGINHSGAAGPGEAVGWDETHRVPPHLRPGWAELHAAPREGAALVAARPVPPHTARRGPGPPQLPHFDVKNQILTGKTPPNPGCGHATPPNT